MRRKRGSVLVGVLWCLALLSVVVIGILHTSRLDLMVVKNHGDTIQAHYLALAGIEKAKAVIYHDMLNRRNTAKNHSGDIYDSPKDFREVQLGRGMFRIVRRGESHESDSIVYGVSDEESRLNLNTASPDELAKLSEMTPDMLAAILDWRDGDNAARPGGAEADYYAALQPPRRPRNGPFRTIRELLMVRGVSQQLLLGDDVNQNGLLDLDDSDDGQGNSGFGGDTCWAGLLTVNSSVRNLNASGNERVNIQTAGENALTSIRGITPQIAKAIIASRGQEEFKNISDLLDVTAPPPGQPSSSNRPSRSNSSGPRVISDDLFIEIVDDLKVKSDETLPGLININTASAEVLTCLQGITPELAQAIVNHRQSSGFFANIGGLLKVPGMNHSVFKQIAPRLTARSETFRIISEGKVTSTGARRRIETVVHVARYNVKTLSYREDL